LLIVFIGGILTSMQMPTMILLSTSSAILWNWCLV